MQSQLGSPPIDWAGAALIAFGVVLLLLEAFVTSHGLIGLSGVIAICVGKSTYARCGIIVNVTPFEPEWEGFVTLEISNTTPLPARVYANEGLCQIIFFQSDEVCETSYADRKGKYQSQKGIVLPKL